MRLRYRMLVPLFLLRSFLIQMKRKLFLRQSFPGKKTCIGDEGSAEISVFTESSDYDNFFPNREV